MRKTKIICTIGPASEKVETLKELLMSGMNVARLNMSHGSHEEHQKRIYNIRKASAETGIPVAIMVDTKGPEIRIGLIDKEKISLKRHEELTLTTQEIIGTKGRIPVNYQNLACDLEAGDQILLDDGLISLLVKEIEDTEILCLVENEGDLKSRKKVNVPGKILNLPALTSQDIADITFAVKEEVDFIAASFIRAAADVLGIRKVLEDLKSEISIISKIENYHGIINLQEIIKVSEGIMVARGDLGVEIPAEDVPLVQKELIEACNLAGKPVITATQMLESMIRNPRPTRAEASDVANAIIDGSDAIMLSGETAIGNYPVKAVKTMATIAMRTEENINWEQIIKKRVSHAAISTTEAISSATCDAAYSLGAAAIITATESGSTARLVSKYRPHTPIIAVTPKASVFRQLLLVWGIIPLISSPSESTDELLEMSISTVLEAGFIKDGDLVVITAGVPLGVPGTTNLIKIHTVGKVLAKGTGVGCKSVSGRVVITNKGEEAVARLKKGDILVTTSVDHSFIPALKKVGALITEVGGLTSEGAVIGINLGIPVVVGVEHALMKLKEVYSVTVDPVRGLIYNGYTKAL